MQLFQTHLNDDLSKIDDWAYEWKMSFNHDSIKAAHEFVFSQYIYIYIIYIIYYIIYIYIFITLRLYLTFNNIPVKHFHSHKHVRLTLDSKLNFDEHISSILHKVNN